MNPVRRQADHHLVMAEIEMSKMTFKPKPKPEKKPKGKRKKYVAPRARVKHALYEVLSKIVRWRDGGCVQAGAGRVACWGVDTDGHIIERAEYGVTFDLLNNHCQCKGHNNWHKYHPTDYRHWFTEKFGIAALDYLETKALSCEGEKSMSTPELEELLVKYQELWDNRPAVYNTAWLIELGYFGDWAKEHLIDRFPMNSFSGEVVYIGLNKGKLEITENPKGSEQ